MKNNLNKIKNKLKPLKRLKTTITIYYYNYGKVSTIETGWHIIKPNEVSKAENRKLRFGYDYNFCRKGTRFDLYNAEELVKADIEHSYDYFNDIKYILINRYFVMYLKDDHDLDYLMMWFTDIDYK